MASQSCLAASEKHGVGENYNIDFSTDAPPDGSR